MSSLKLRALAGVCALMGAAGLGASAQAQSPVNGGGSTLLAPYWQQAARCFDRDVANRTLTLKGIPVSSQTIVAPTGVTCQTVTGNTIAMDATGSGAGQAGLLAHAAVIEDTQGGVLTTLFGSLNANHTGQVYSSIQYGLSDNSLVNADLVAYDKGTNATETLAFQGNSGPFTSATTYQGLTYDASGTTTGGASGTDYPVAKALYGPLVQFPASIDPVAITFNSTFTSGGVQHTFNIQNGGVLHLDAATYCGIFSHTITDWNNTSLTSLNGNVSLTGGVSVPIQLVGRSDSSGTTSIFTRHLSKVCGTGNAFGSAGSTTIPTGLQSFYTLSSGSSGVASTVNSTQASIAYIGPDYVEPAVQNTGADAFTLPAAALQNAAGNFELPTATNASTAFGVLHPPQSNVDGSGNYDATITSSDRHDPTQWVQSTANTSVLANPSAASAYPIVGTTNFMGYTCYSSTAKVNTLVDFLDYGGGASGKIILNNAALGQLPSEWLVAIQNTFLDGTSDSAAHALGLFMTSGGTGVCSGITGA